MPARGAGRLRAVIVRIIHIRAGIAAQRRANRQVGAAHTLLNGHLLPPALLVLVLAPAAELVATLPPPAELVAVLPPPASAPRL